MPTEADPAIHADPLWLALERSKNALADNPRILFEKTHEWEDGLNILGCNKLAEQAGLGKVFATEETKDKETGSVAERWLIANHPTIDAPIRWLCWARVAFTDAFNFSQTKLRRTLEYLAAWQDRRAEQLRAGTPPRPEASGIVTGSSGYVSATKILNDHDPQRRVVHMAALKRILKRHPEIGRDKPKKNRLVVHLGDWAVFYNREYAAPSAQEVEPSPDEIRERARSLRRAR